MQIPPSMGWDQRIRGQPHNQHKHNDLSGRLMKVHVYFMRGMPGSKFVLEGYLAFGLWGYGSKLMRWRGSLGHHPLEHSTKTIQRQDVWWPVETSHWTPAPVFSTNCLSCAVCIQERIFKTPTTFETGLTYIGPDDFSFELIISFGIIPKCMWPHAPRLRIKSCPKKELADLLWGPWQVVWKNNGAHKLGIFQKLHRYPSCGASMAIVISYPFPSNPFSKTPRLQ